MPSGPRSQRAQATPYRPEWAIALSRPGASSRAMTHTVTLRGLKAAGLLPIAYLGLSGMTPLSAATQVTVTNLVSNGAVPAVTIDPNLVNPWGLAHSPTSPFWISDNGTGVSTLYNGAGTKIPLTVTVPPPGGSTGSSAPTGIVFNANSGSFQVGGATPAFIFSTE